MSCRQRQDAGKTVQLTHLRWLHPHVPGWEATWHSRREVTVGELSLTLPGPLSREALISDANYHTNRSVIPRFLFSKSSLGKSVSLRGRSAGVTVWGVGTSVLAPAASWLGGGTARACHLSWPPALLTGGFQSDFSPRLLAAQGQR